MRIARSLLIAAILAELLSVTNAQAAAFDRGTWLVGGSASYTYTGSQKALKAGASVSGFSPDSHFTELRLNPSVQYFLGSRLAIGANLSVNRFGQHGSTTSAYRIGPVSSLFFWAKKAFHPYLTAAASAGKIAAPSIDYDHLNYRVSGGVLFMLSPSAGLSGEIFREKSKDTGDEYDLYRSTTTDTFGFAFGLAVFLWDSIGR